MDRSSDDQGDPVARHERREQRLVGMLGGIPEYPVSQHVVYPDGYRYGPNVFEERNLSRDQKHDHLANAKDEVRPEKIITLSKHNFIMRTRLQLLRNYVQDTTW